MSRPAAETIGRCEWCGLVDHHLVAGQCSRCAERVPTHLSKRLRPTPQAPGQAPLLDLVARLYGEGLR